MNHKVEEKINQKIKEVAEKSDEISQIINFYSNYNILLLKSLL